MEQKKTLWIIAGVGLFLLVILLAAMIFYKPTSNRVQVATNVVPVENTKNDSGWTPVVDTEELPLITDSTTPETEVPAETNPEDSLNVSDLFVVSENTTIYDLNQNTTEDSNGTTTIDLNALKNQLLAEEKNNSQPQNINITVNLPEADVKTSQEGTNTNVSVTAPVTTKTQTAAEQEKTEKAASVKVNTTASETPKTTSTTKQTTTSTTSTKPATTTKTTSTTTTAKPATTTSASTTVTRYWIQVASYSTKKAAEAARSKLVENKIVADIFTYQDSSEKVYYRVRVGPYTTKSEAEYWMNKIIQIKDFEKSGAYVTQTKN